MSFKFPLDYTVQVAGEFFRPAEHEGEMLIWWSDGTVQDLSLEFGEFPNTPVLPLLVATPLTEPRPYRHVEVLQQVLSKSMQPQGVGYGRLVKKGRAWVLQDLHDDEVRDLGKWFKANTDDQGVYVAPEGGYADGEGAF